VNDRGARAGNPAAGGGFSAWNPFTNVAPPLGIFEWVLMWNCLTPLLHFFRGLQGLCLNPIGKNQWPCRSAGLVTHAGGGPKVSGQAGERSDNHNFTLVHRNRWCPAYHILRVTWCIPGGSVQNGKQYWSVQVLYHTTEHRNHSHTRAIYSNTRPHLCMDGNVHRPQAYMCTFLQPPTTHVDSSQVVKHWFIPLLSISTDSAAQAWSLEYLLVHL